MIFAINNLKYDTDKMDLISEKCEYSYASALFNMQLRYLGRDVKLWRSKNNRWLLTYNKDFNTVGKSLTEEEAKNLLIKYDLNKYEEIFGGLEEA